MLRAFQDTYGVEVCHAWGMTEMSPLGSLGSLKPECANLTGEQRLDVQVKQGHAPFGVEMKIVDDANKELPRDGKTFGRLKVRGPAIARAYFRETSDILDQEDFFDTGDVATISPDGYIMLVDRTKDLVKSGGEWISSVELENEIMAHPSVREAAVIGVPDEKWGERPLACVVPEDGEQLDADALRDFLSDRVAKWWIPERVEFIEEVPKTSVGKFSKKDLRARFAEHALPS